MKIKDKQFIDEYFNNGFNATQAYKSVHPNVKDSTARSKASLIMTMPEVKEYIKEKQEQITIDNSLELTKTISKLFYTRDNAVKDSDVLRAIELIFKANGMLVDKVEAKMDANITFIGEDNLED